MRTLRDDQNDALNMLRATIGRGNKRIVMKAPTGYGKTVLAAQLVANARAKGKTVLFTVPAISLVDQTVQKFFEQGIDEVGVIQAAHEMTDWSQPVQVASVQTLQRRQLPKADVVLIDECHRWYRFYETWLTDPAWASVPIIGLSATPWTKGLGAWFKELIIASTTQELIEAGMLSQFKVFAPSHPDLSNVRTVAGDYHEGDLANTMGDSVLVADVVKTWLEKGRGRPTLCFAVNCDHAQVLTERFEQAGVKVAYQDAYTKPDERRKIEYGFADGSIEIVVNVGTLTTGVDWDVRCIVLARPTKSDMLFVQMIGRGLRTADGKDHCLILDHSDTHLRLGFVTDVDAKHTGLNHGKTNTGVDKTIEEKIRPPKECPSCGALKAPKITKCPSCGFEAKYVLTPEEKLKEGHGELQELKPKKVQATMDQKAFFLAEMKGYAQSKGYKDGWAANKYREKYGVWPDPSIKSVAPAASISPQTASWIKHSQIKWAKSKYRHQRSNQWQAA